MDFSFRRRRVGGLYLKYSLLFVILALAMFGGYWLTGHTLIWNADALNQHLPLMGQWKTMVVNWLHHPARPLSQWSWQMGLGTDTFQVFSYYTIGDVFSYLSLLFPAAKLTLAYQVIIVLRVYCVGLAFCYLAQHFDFSDRVIVAGAAVYLVNSYLLYAAVAQPMFTTTFMLFPLIVVQIERVLQQGSAWPLAAAFTWMLVANYYLAFVVGIGALIYLVLRVATHYRHGLNWGRTVLKLAFATVTSLLLSAGLLIPELLAVQNSTRVGAQFANGLTTYPLYYYLFLPKQLINGGNASFMFWAALGLASIVFLALVYLYSRPRQAPLLAISLALALVMLLIPAVGALFNGGMAASNRWTLLIYLPLALTTCHFLRAVPTLTPKDLKLLTIATGIYLLVLLATYFFQNDAGLFVPVLFLVGSLLVVYKVRFLPGPRPESWLLSVIVLNVGFNALYAALPYNGGFASDMLTRGQYQAATKERYGGLDRDLPHKDFYRVNTISNNPIVDENLRMYNDLTSGRFAVKSYYSLQNKYLGNFAQAMQLSQYQTNIPLGQLDDRTVLNNFLGVKYLFVQSSAKNATKLPAGYTLDKATPPKINYDLNQPTNPRSKAELVPVQTSRYVTKNNFPLLYWQDRVISPRRYAQLSPTERERALAVGVTVADAPGALKGLARADLQGLVVRLPSQLISNRLNRINPAQLHYRDEDETYQLTFPALTKKAFAKQTADSELHLDFQQIRYRPLSMKQQLAADAEHDQYMAVNPGQAYNRRFARYQNWRAHVLNGSPDPSFTLTVTSAFGQETLRQPKQSVLSFFKLVRAGTMNVGYFSGHLPSHLTFQPNKLGDYRLDYQAVAEKLGPTYDRQVATLQKHGIKDLQLTPNRVSGRITTTRPGILTSSIPYSSGWRASVNGRPIKLLRTNQAFLGLRLPAGDHRIVLTYRVPGLALGARVSLIGLVWTLGAALVSWAWRRKNQ